MDGIAYLIQKTYGNDEIGQMISESETRMEIFVTVESVSRREWSDAGKSGLNPEIKITTAVINYSGEKEVEYNGIRYAIYRSYHPSNTDQIELYLERKNGVE